MVKFHKELDITLSYFCISLHKLFAFGNCSTLSGQDMIIFDYLHICKINLVFFEIAINNQAQLGKSRKRVILFFFQCLMLAFCKLAFHWAFSVINTYIVLHRRRMVVGNESALPEKLQIGTN